MKSQVDNLLEGYTPMDGLNQDTPQILAVEEFTYPALHVRIQGRFGDGSDPQFHIYFLIGNSSIWRNL